MHYLGVSPVLHFHPSLPLKGFKAYQIEPDATAAVSCQRRDLYTFSLVTAKSRICYQEGEKIIDGSVLVFASPCAAYFWERLSLEQSGYCCLFTKEFLSWNPHLAIFLQSPLLGLGEVSVCPLNQAQTKRMATIFGQILLAQASDYRFKHDLIGNCLHLLTHEALKMQPYEKG